MNYNAKKEEEEGAEKKGKGSMDTKQAARADEASRTKFVAQKRRPKQCQDLCQGSAARSTRMTWTRIDKGRISPSWGRRYYPSIR